MPKAKSKPHTKATAEGIETKAVREKPAGFVFGRPTLYDPSYCEKVIEWGKLGKSVTWMAASLDVTKGTIYEWINTHQDFSDAIERAKVHCQLWWEDAGQSGMVADKFNSAVWQKNMSARFRSDWAERQEHTGAEGGPIQHQVGVSWMTESQAKARGWA